jgi:hypothetical protein
MFVGMSKDSSGLPLRLDLEMAFNGVHIWWVKADAKGLAEVKELVGPPFDLACLEEPQMLDHTVSCSRPGPSS